jgi:hypothetical protein
MSEDLLEQPTTEQRQHEGEQPRGKGGNRNRQPRQGGDGDERKRRKHGSDRKGTNGFADGVERAFCSLARSQPATGFPVQARTGTAVIAPIIVGKRDKAILYCDCPDHAVHVWPDGEVADTPSS